jgi:hypothetical protein
LFFVVKFSLSPSTMSREGNPKVLAAQLELSHKMLRHEWDRIKHDPSLRFTIVSEVKECYLEICRKPVGKAVGIDFFFPVAILRT